MLIRKFALILLMTSSFAHAAIESPVKDSQQLPAATTYKTDVERDTAARVVAANYDLIGQDFPEMAQKPQESTEQWKARVDEWLLRETPYILTKHVDTSTANTPIQVDQNAVKVGFHPLNYNRAHVLPVQDGAHTGMIDEKGTGIANAKPGNKTDGLATLGEMIREFLFEKLVSKVFQHSGINARTIGNYAVLDLGFDVIHADGSKSRAGMILRQAHIRSTGINSSLTPEQGTLVESTLRRYGLTSSGETMNGSHDFDYINVQGTGRQDMIEMIDFGAVMAVDKFTRRWVNNLMQPVANPGDANYVQPDPNLRVDLNMWGDFGVHDPKQDKPFVWSHELAESFAKGTATRADVEQHFHNFMDAVETKFHIGGACHAVYR